MEPTGGRRATDNISAAVQLAIEEAVADTRHTLRDEITVFAAQLEVFRLQSTKEHAEVQAHVMELVNDMSEVKALIPRVADLEQNIRTNAAVSEAIDKLIAQGTKTRTATRNLFIALAGLIVAATSVLAGLLAG